ncbi:SRPBCC family protein [Pseudomonas sp. CGJS7]|uniref:SRPBCC family protein n=1 Tax=Pseudomonas sp. CGJS7 TaxID=3109348 RepID=UPI00300AD3EF
MHLSLTAERRIAAAPEAVFALALDSERFPALFDGCGPIPGLKRITPLAPPAIGSLRALENRDGSKLMERITALEPPHRHAYVLSGMRPPLAWLAREGHAEWTFEAEHGNGNDATRVVWRYDFELTSALAWPIAAPLLRGFMREAMQRCLERMAQVLEAAWRAERR